MAVTCNIRSGLQGTHTKVGDGATGTYPITAPADTSITDGTSSNMADRYYFDTRSLTTGASEDLDIAGGLTDFFGTTLTFVEVVYLRITASTANTTNLTIGGDANGFLFTTAAADTVVLTPGDSLIRISPVAGMAVTAGTGDVIQVANAAGATASYDIEILGRSA